MVARGHGGGGGPDECAVFREGFAHHADGVGHVGNVPACGAVVHRHPVISWVQTDTHWSVGFYALIVQCPSGIIGAVV